MKIKLFADGANADEMVKHYRSGKIHGFTTNPTLMKKAGVRDYEDFAKSVLREIPDLPISFEVFSDEWDEMERQGLKIASWGDNVNVKIPITNTRSESALPLCRKLLDQGCKLNVTALFTEQQVQELHDIMKPSDDVIVSIFAGRIADTGVDPVPLMKKAVEMYRDRPKAQILWASPREVLNLYQAEECGCHILTATTDIINKVKLAGKDLGGYSLETVQMFYKDAQEAGFQL